MGYLLPALTAGEVRQPARRRAERAAAELREPAVRPRAASRSSTALFPPDHPYHWPTIGIADDLRAAIARRRARVLRDATTTRPTPRSRSPATSTPTRAFDARRAVLRRDPAGPAPRRCRVPSAPRRARRRGSCSRIASSCRASISAWHSPAMFAHGDAELDLLADVLGERQDARGSTGRSSTSGGSRPTCRPYQQSRELGGMFQIAATAAPGARCASSRRSSTAELGDVAGDGPTRRRDRARPRAGRGAVRLPAADGRRLRRQVRPAERLQRLPRRPRLLQGRPRSLRAADRAARCAAAGGRVASSPRVALSVVPAGARGAGAARVRTGGGFVKAWIARRLAGRGTGARHPSSRA